MASAAHIEDLAAEAEGEAQGIASSLGSKADKATEAVGAGMEHLGEAMRSHAPNEGALGDAARTVARKLESGGRYLEEKGLHGIGEDITQIVRENPVPALVIGLGIGFALARILRS